MMTTQTKSVLIGLCMVIAAVGALLFTTSRENSEEVSTDNVVFSGNPTTSTEPLSGSTGVQVDRDDLIVEFLPRGGIGAACSEDVGVQVAQGFSAELTINGIKMEPNQLNVFLNDDGSISNEITATRSKGQFSFTPSPDCPNGPLVRPTNNVLSVCVYSSSDVTQSCILTETYQFDAI